MDRTPPHPIGVENMRKAIMKIREKNAIYPWSKKIDLKYLDQVRENALYKRFKQQHRIENEENDDEIYYEGRKTRTRYVQIFNAIWKSWSICKR